MLNQKFTDEEIMDILRKSNFPDGLNLKQMLKVQYWAILNKKKFQLFIMNLNNGKNMKFAYLDTKQTKK
jgi:hypothetical protein